LDPLIIEAAINELSQRRDNPNVPFSVEEVVEDALRCAQAGASIVHFHARDPDTGEQRWLDTSFYLEAFTRIRAQSDVILYPTQAGYRWDQLLHVFELADAGVLEWTTVDVIPGLWTEGDPPPDALIGIMTELKRRGVLFSLGVREIGHVRHIEQYRDLGLLDQLVLKIFFTDKPPLGPRPDVRGLQMYLDSVPTGLVCHWFMTASTPPEQTGASAGTAEPTGQTFRRMSMLTVAMGGHVRTGLGDHPQLDGAKTTNEELVQAAAALGNAAGRGVATPAQARKMLGLEVR
jgi:3-keto-5-aminohexanoate cleavage enzyme